MKREITVPYNLKIRPYQVNLYNCLENGFKRGIAVWHRRAGKDKTFMGILAKEAFKRVGAYFYILPFYAQARKVIWNAIDKDGFRVLHHVPPILYERMDNQNMTLTLKNGSMLYFLGSDNIDSIVGTNPVGVLFSEFSLHKPQAWDYLRPILMENDGWALFNGTPRGRNHMYKMLKTAETNPEWYSEVLTISDTGVMTDADVEKEIEEEGMNRQTAMQEFYCSFDAALVGAYYTDQMNRMLKDNRILTLPWEPDLEVFTAWDLGIDDELVILFAQLLNREVRIIDVMHNNGKGLDYYVKQMKDLPYVYGGHLLPHDVKVRELTTGKSREETLYSLGLNNIITVPRASVEDGINASRALLNRTWIDKVKGDYLIESLRAYHSRWDESKQTYTGVEHDWSSHGADAFRMLATGLPLVSGPKGIQPVMAEGLEYDPFLSSQPRHSYSRPRPSHHEDTPEPYYPWDTPDMHPAYAGGLSW